MDAMVVSGAVTCLGISAVGSAIGTGIAAAAAVAAWKKCYAANKPAPFTLLTFVGLPLSQTLYGMILMFVMNAKAAVSGAGPAMLVLGLFSGLGIAASAVFQGRAAAVACDAQSETGQGLANYVIALGVVETVAIFVMVFTIISIGKIA